MKLYEACPVCDHRKNAFFHFCPSCGADKPPGEASPPEATSVTAVA